MFDASTFAGMNFASSMLTAFGNYEQGKQAQKADEYNAQIAEMRAKATRESAKLTAFQKQKQIGQAIGQETAAYAHAGVVATAGSALDVMVNSLSNAYLDLAIDNYNTEVAARGLQAQANMDRYEGKQAALAGLGKAGMTLLSGASSYGMNMIQPVNASTESWEMDPRNQ